MRIFIVLFLSLGASAQTVVNGGRTFTGPLIATGSSETAPMQTGTTLPATCTTGDQFFKSNATAGQNIYGCTATNIWTLQSSGGITQLTGDVTAGPGTGSQATTLATVNSNVGVCGDATHICQQTINGKGLTTAAAPISILTGTGNAASLQTVAFSSTPAFICPSSSAGTVVTFELSTALTASITPTISGCTPGSLVIFRLKEPASGGTYNYGVTWPSGWTTVCQPAPFQGAETFLLATYDGTTGKGQCGTDATTSVSSESAMPSGTPASGSEWCVWDSTELTYRCKNSTGVISALAKELTAGSARCAGGVATVDAPCTTLLMTGIVDGLAPVTITTTATATLGGTYKSGYTFNQEATAATAITYTLPTAATGLQYCVGNSWNGSAATTGTVEILTSAAGQFIIYTDGTLSATGGYVISGGAAADFACVVGLDSTHWLFRPSSGTWTKH